MLVDHLDLQPAMLALSRSTNVDNGSPEPSSGFRSISKQHPGPTSNFKNTELPCATVRDADEIPELLADTESAKVAGASLARPHSTTVKVANIPKRTDRENTQQ